jgi:hypothetical protein
VYFKWGTSLILSGHLAEARTLMSPGCGSGLVAISKGSMGVSRVRVWRDELRNEAVVTWRLVRLRDLAGQGGQRLSLLRRII